MTAVTITRVARTFGSVRAVAGVSLDIAAGELFTLLGPSGCGKTTLLRMVAGFCDLDEGSIHFGERRIDGLPPHRRNTGMVFQSYAIFPNLTVADNVAYGLKARAVAAAETRERVERALTLVHLPGFGGRWPHQLSGGQLQRVALARALVIEPDVLLLDEPLSNLDAQLRVDMRREIRALQQRLGITAIYVTHDQEEALAISDRIAVMRAGKLEQVGPPAAIYRSPATPFVAEFLGATNLLTGRVEGRDGAHLVVSALGRSFRVPAVAAAAGSTLAFSLRPEALQPVAGAADGLATVAGEIDACEHLGALLRIDVRLGDGPPLRAAMLDDGRAAPAIGSPVTLAYDPDRITVFPP
ncbi:MAG: ABC transporter ATP-binding protein [Alphaproteobacteria bacterium]